jgi:hypothetical protein
LALDIPAFLTALRGSGPLVFSAIAIASGIVIFVPSEVATTLGLDQFRDEHRSSLGAAFVLALALVLVKVLYKIVQGVKKRLRWRNSEKVRHRYLEELTPEEKGYLAPYVFGQLNTQHFLIEDGIVGGLVAKTILFRSSNVFSMHQGPAYNLQPWARTRLTEKPELLDGAILPERYRGLLDD